MAVTVTSPTFTANSTWQNVAGPVTAPRAGEYRARVLGYTQVAGSAVAYGVSVNATLPPSVSFSTGQQAALALMTLAASDAVRVAANGNSTIGNVSLELMPTRIS
jgi:hypothetical protein